MDYLRKRCTMQCCQQGLDFCTRIGIVTFWPKHVYLDFIFQEWCGYGTNLQLECLLNAERTTVDPRYSHMKDPKEKMIRILKLKG